MTDKKGRSLIKIVKSLFYLLPAVLGLVTNLCRLVSTEARLAGRSLIVIFILAIFLIMLMTTTWLCLLGIFFVYLIAHMSWMAALGVLLGVNILLIFIAALMMMSAKKKLSFPETREQLRGLSRFYKN